MEVIALKIYSFPIREFIVLSHVSLTTAGLPDILPYSSLPDMIAKLSLKDNRVSIIV